MVEVLEHVCDLRCTLDRVRGLLMPGGTLFLEVPDATAFADSPDAPFQEFSIEHINYFSPASLTNLLASCGFLRIQCEQTPVEVTPGRKSTILRAAFRLRSDGDHEKVVRDVETEPRLRAYIEQSLAVERRIHEVTAGLADRGESVIVWGVGTHTQRLLATSRLADAPISAFVDSNPRYQGQVLRGVPVVAPSELLGRPDPILVSSRVCQSAIVHQIRETLLLPNEVITLYVLD
jgi:hypothetical protein